MEVITIESAAFRALMGKVDEILCYIKKKERRAINDRIISSADLAEVLGISTRTLQRLRSSDTIKYRLIKRRCYYEVSDIQSALQERTLCCNPKNMKELHRNLLIRSKPLDYGVVR